MTTFTNGKPAPADGPIEINLSASSSDLSAQGLSVAARYYFNLTNGETMIRDEEGIVASSIRAAVVSAMEAVDELRGHDPSNSDEWQGWRLEIVDASGQAIQAIPLDALSAH
jgi:type IV secretory pathway VirB4 component